MCILKGFQFHCLFVTRKFDHDWSLNHCNHSWWLLYEALHDVYTQRICMAVEAIHHIHCWPPPMAHRWVGRFSGLPVTLLTISDVTTGLSTSFLMLCRSLCMLNTSTWPSKSSAVPICNILVLEGGLAVSTLLRVLWHSWDHFQLVLCGMQCLACLHIHSTHLHGPWGAQPVWALSGSFYLFDLIHCTFAVICVNSNAMSVSAPLDTSVQLVNPSDHIQYHQVGSLCMHHYSYLWIQLWFEILLVPSLAYQCKAELQAILEYYVSEVSGPTHTELQLILHIAKLLVQPIAAVFPCYAHQRTWSACMHGSWTVCLVCTWHCASNR